MSSSTYSDLYIPEEWKKPQPLIAVTPCPACGQSGRRWWRSGGHWVQCQPCEGRGWRVVISDGRDMTIEKGIE